MKYKKLFLMVFSTFCVLGIVSFAYMQNHSASELTLKVSSPKNIYKLGEPLIFSFELSNNSNEAITLLDVFGTETGFLHIKVSQGSSEFLGANDPNWGRLDTSGKTYIKPTENVRSEGNILWNWSSQETSVFRFDKPGVYYFKAYYTAMIEGENSKIKLESEPIQITIEEPVGEDLKAWNKIKANGDFAYFIQKGNVRIPSYKPEERAKFLREVEQILADYPNSFYTESLQQSLDKFRANEAKIQENMRKIQNQM